MDYLGLALFAEGPTDHRFFQPLLHRLCVDLCLAHARRPVEVAQVLELHGDKRLEGGSRETRIADAARQSASSWRLLFVHSDGEGDPRAAVAECVDPAAVRIAAELGHGHEVVPLVPVRETEAWALADGDALRSVFGTSLPDAALGLPSPVRLAEGLLDPKATLSAAYQVTNPTRRRGRMGAPGLLGSLGEQVSFDRLRHLQSFNTFELSLTAALRRLRVLD